MKATEPAPAVLEKGVGRMWRHRAAALEKVRPITGLGEFYPFSALVETTTTTAHTGTDTRVVCVGTFPCRCGKVYFHGHER